MKLLRLASSFPARVECSLPFEGVSKRDYSAGSRGRKEKSNVKLSREALSSAARVTLNPSKGETAESEK